MHRLCLISVFFVSDLFYDDLCYGIYGSPIFFLTLLVESLTIATYHESFLAFNAEVDR